MTLEVKINTIDNKADNGGIIRSNKIHKHLKMWRNSPLNNRQLIIRNYRLIRHKA